MDFLTELLKLVPDGPWKVVFAAVVAGVSALPTLARTWGEHRSRRRHFDRLRTTLELLKLRYEIETLRRQNDLPELPIDETLDGPLAVLSPHGSVEKKRLTVLRRLLWSACGGLLFFAVVSSIAAFDAEDDFQTIQDLLSWVIGGVVLAIPASFPAALIRNGGRRRLIFFGFLCSLVVTIGFGLLVALVIAGGP